MSGSKKGDSRIIFAIAGIAMLIGGIIFISASNSFMSTAVETRAIIVDIVEYIDNDDEKQYNTIVEYYVDGVRYESGTGGHSAGDKIGKAVNIHYNPDDPSEFRSKGDDMVISIALLFMGAAFLFVGVAPKVLSLKNKRNQTAP